MKFRNGAEHKGQKPRLVIQLNYHGNRFAFGIFIIGKNIVFVFVKRASADSHGIHSVLHGFGSA